MSYMLLILEPSASGATRTEAEGPRGLCPHAALRRGLHAQGKLMAVESLASQASAVRVHAPWRQGPGCSTAPSPRPRR